MVGRGEGGTLLAGSSHGSNSSAAHRTPDIAGAAPVRDGRIRRRYTAKPERRPALLHPLNSAGSRKMGTGSVRSGVAPETRCRHGACPLFPQPHAGGPSKKGMAGDRPCRHSVIVATEPVPIFDCRPGIGESTNIPFTSSPRATRSRPADGHRRDRRRGPRDPRGRSRS